MQRALTIGLDSYQVQLRDDGQECALLTPSGVQLHAFQRSVAHRDFPEELGQRLRHAAFSPDGRWLAASADKCLGVWDLAESGRVALAEEGFEARPCWTPEGGELFGSRNSDRGTACFRWRLLAATNAAAPPRLERLPLPTPAGFTFLSLRSNAVVLTTANRSELLGPEELATGSEHWVRTSDGINGTSPDGHWLAIYRPFAKSLYVYHLPDLHSVATLSHPTSIGDFQFSPLGDELAVASRWGVEFWSTRTWEGTRVLTNFSRILYTPDARTWWLDKDLRTAGLYDARTLTPLLMLPTGMIPLALSLDGRQLAVSVDGHRLQVWDLAAVHAELAGLGLDW
jgi:WD40 repeat protein